jgi:hypothetical protein
VSTDEHHQHIIERLLASIDQIAQIQRRYPPVSGDAIALAEALLGFALPPLLKIVYRTVSDGGWGPAGKLFQLNPPASSWENDYDSHSLVHTYLRLRQAASANLIMAEGSDGSKHYFYWPVGVIILSTRGCNISSCIDCFGDSDYPVMRSYGHNAFWLESPSLSHWLGAWADGEPLIDLHQDATPSVSFPEPARYS